MIACTQGERQSQMILRVVQDVASNTLNIVYIGTFLHSVSNAKRAFAGEFDIMLSFCLFKEGPLKVMFTKKSDSAAKFRSNCYCHRTFPAAVAHLAVGAIECTGGIQYRSTSGHGIYLRPQIYCRRLNIPSEPPFLRGGEYLRSAPAI